MKIALIEDRLGRLEQFVDFNLQSCQEVDIISANNYDKLIAALQSNDTTGLNQYACIASHRSAMSNEIRDTLKAYCKAHKTPLVFFSGGITSSVFKDDDFPFLHINSKDFYSNNLKLFIEDYHLKSTPNLLILQFGNRWKLSLLLNLRNSIALAQNKQVLKDENPETGIEDSELIKRVRDLKINSLIKPDLMNVRTNVFLSGDNFLPVSVEQINDVKSIINHLINKMA